MPKRSERSSRYPDRSKTKSGKYTTLAPRNTRPEPRHKQKAQKKKKAFSLIIASIFTLALLAGAFYMFFNWDSVLNLTTKTVMGVMGTPTVMPTSLPTPSPTPAPSPTALPTEAPAVMPSSTPRPDKVNIRISVVGDMSFYQTQLDDAFDMDTNTYDFNHNFEIISPVLQQADLLIGSLNTTLTGIEQGYTGAPKFNTPESVLDSLENAGFDVLITGTPTVFSQGWIGVERTNYFINHSNIKTTGTYLTQDEYYEPLIIDVNGVKVAILSYIDEDNLAGKTTGVSSDKLAYCVKQLKISSVQRDVDLCKTKGADIIIAYVNWGDEHSQAPSSDIKEDAQKMLESGVDTILGIHPQSVHHFTRKMVDGKQVFVAYSLGNFISSQRTQKRESSIILNLEYEQDNVLGKTYLSDVSYMPIWISMAETDTVDKNFQILPVGKYIDDPSLLSSLSASSQARIQDVWTEITTILGEGEARAIK